MNSDRATQKWVAREFGVRIERVRELTDAGEIPYLRIHEGVRGDGTTFTEYRYSKTQIQSYLRRRGELDAERVGVAS